MQFSIGNAGKCVKKTLNIFQLFNYTYSMCVCVCVVSIQIRVASYCLQNKRQTQMNITNRPEEIRAKQKKTGFLAKISLICKCFLFFYNILIVVYMLKMNLISIRAFLRLKIDSKNQVNELYINYVIFYINFKKLYQKYI